MSTATPKPYHPRRDLLEECLEKLRRDNYSPQYFNETERSIMAKLVEKELRHMIPEYDYND